MRCTELAEQLGIADLVRFVPPVDRADAGPVVPRGRRRRRARRTASRSGSWPSRPRPAARPSSPPPSVACPPRSAAAGVLVDGHDTADWATAIAWGLLDPTARAGLGPRRRAEHAAGFCWARTARAARRGLRRRDGPPARARRSTRPRLLTGIPHGGHPVTDRCHRVGDGRGVPHRVRARVGARRARRRVRRRRCPGEQKLKTVASLVVVRQRAVGLGVRHPQPRREPRRVSTASCCAATCGCPGSRTRVDRAGDVYVTGPGPGRRGGRRVPRPAARGGAHRRRRAVQRAARHGLPQLDAQGVGVARLARREPAQPRGVPHHPGPAGRPRDPPNSPADRPTDRHPAGPRAEAGG